MKGAQIEDHYNNEGGPKTKESKRDFVISPFFKRLPIEKMNS